MNTAAVTARRRVTSPVKNDKSRSEPQKQESKKTKSLKSIHQKSPLIIPLSNSKVKIEPRQPCHVLKVYKNQPINDIDSIKQENLLLRERLRALESGIVKVSHVLSDDRSSTSLPSLPDTREHEEDSKMKRSDIMESGKSHKKSKKDKKKKEEIKQLLLVVEESLANLTKVLNKIQAN